MMDENDLEHIWELLQDVKDPEIPTVSVVELGMIRNVGREAGRVYVTMTPTFIGCPAVDIIQQNITQKLNDAGIEDIEVTVSFSQPWSSDLITREGRKKLKEFGLSPPPMHSGDLERALIKTAHCPFCDSENTVLKNSFGPTQCRAIYICNNCHQPFEQFKPV